MVRTAPSDGLGGGFSARWQLLEAHVFLSVLPSGEKGKNDVTKALGNRKETKLKGDGDTGRARAWDGPVRAWAGLEERATEGGEPKDSGHGGRGPPAVASAGVPLLGTSQPPEATIIIIHLTGQGGKADGDRAAQQGRSRLGHTRDRAAALHQQPASRAPSPVVSVPHACLECHCSHGSPGF